MPCLPARAILFRGAGWELVGHGFDCDINCAAPSAAGTALFWQKKSSHVNKESQKGIWASLELKKYFRKAEGEHGLYFAVKMMKGQCIFLNREKDAAYTGAVQACELYQQLMLARWMRMSLVMKTKFPGNAGCPEKRYSDEINERIKRNNI